MQARTTARQNWCTRVLALFLALFAVSPALAQTPGGSGPAVVGTWVTANQSRVTIAACGDGYCGRLTRVSVPPSVYAAHRAEIDAVGMQNLPDIRNKNPALRHRRMLGLEILKLPTVKTPTLLTGQIYNAEDGNTYSGRLRVVSRDRLRLTGCGFFNLVCRSEDWIRAE